MARLNLDRFGNQKRIEKIALVVIRQIVERDMNRNKEEYLRRITKNPTYQDLLEQYGMNLGDLMRLAPKVQEELQSLEE